jgi:hypothetical protein
MDQAIDAGPREVRILAPVQIGVEVRRPIAAFVPTSADSAQRLPEEI